MSGIFAQRSFDISDQQAFAELSGDANPMHLDPRAARRTQAGAPVVHGLHLALWALDALARSVPRLPAATGLTLRAQRMVYLEESVTARLVSQDARGLEVELRTGGTVTTRLSIATDLAPAEGDHDGPDGTWRHATRQDAAWQDRARQDAARQDAARQDAARQDGLVQDAAGQDGAPQDRAGQDGTPQDGTPEVRARHERAPQEQGRQDEPQQQCALPEAQGPEAALPDDALPAGPLFAPERPLCLTAQDVPGMAGHVALATPEATAAAMFPAAAAWLGARRIAALACGSRLVGMVCPGLYSILGGMSVGFTAGDEACAGLGFRVTGFDSRFGMTVTAIGGGGLRGTVTSFLRSPPAAQPSLAELACLVGARQFTGSVALVIGGSRGLGEVTAKLLAAGGARVVLTYAAGQDDAQRVAGEIRATGGTSQVIAYDVGRPAADQLAALHTLPTHLYYFATPQIARRKAGLFDAEHHRRFLTFYVAAFHDLCKTLLARGATLRALYPSTVLVEDHPLELTEYAMAKLAGEVLCRDMNRALAGIQIHVARLPRVSTDQAAGVMKQRTVPAVAAMLPLIERMHAAA